MCALEKSRENDNKLSEAFRLYAENKRCEYIQCRIQHAHEVNSRLPTNLLHSWFVYQPQCQRSPATFLNKTFTFQYRLMSILVNQSIVL